MKYNLYDYDIITDEHMKLLRNLQRRASKTHNACVSTLYLAFCKKINITECGFEQIKYNK